MTAAEIAGAMAPASTVDIMDTTAGLIWIGYVEVDLENMTYRLTDEMLEKARQRSEELRHAKGDTPTETLEVDTDGGACYSRTPAHARNLETNSLRDKNKLPKATTKNLPSLRSGSQKVSAKPPTFIAEDFIADASMLEWAAKEVPDVDVESETKKFVDYWMAESGAKAKKRDWRRAWQVWLRREAERAAQHRRLPRLADNSKPTFYEPEPPAGMDLYSPEYQKWRAAYIEDWARKNGAAR